MIEKAYFFHFPYNKCNDNKNFIKYVRSESCINVVISFLNNINFSRGKLVLVLPILSDNSIKYITKRLEFFIINKKLNEIVLNDIGSIIYFRNRYKRIKINIGRILMHHFIKTYDFSSYLKQFIMRYNINGIEIDDLGDYYKINDKISSSSLHFYIDKSLVAVTRFCPWSKKWNIEKCSFSCHYKSKEIVSKNLGYKMYLEECGYYIKKNNNLDKKYNFSRIIFEL